MSEAFQEEEEGGGEGGISVKTGNNANFQYENSLSRDLDRGEESSNAVKLGKNDEETSHLLKNHKVLESDNLESSKQLAESSGKSSKKELSENFSHEKTSKAKNNEEEEEQSLEKKFGKIESIDKFMTLHFNPFTIEEEFIDINNFDSKDIEKRALDLDILDASETPVNYKYNRTQNQTTRGYWNKKKEGIEAQLEQQELEANNAEGSDSDEESVPVKDLLSQAENIKF